MESGLIDAARELLATWSQDLDCVHPNGNFRPLTPPLPPFHALQNGTLSEDETPISRFRQDSMSTGVENGDNNSGSNNHSNDESTLLRAGQQPPPPPQQAESVVSMDDEILKLRESHSMVTEEHMDVDQAREAISAVSDPTPSRLSDGRIQQILLAAMRYEKDHAPTVASRQPTITDSGDDSNNILLGSTGGGGTGGSFASIPSQAPSIPNYTLPDNNHHQQQTQQSSPAGAEEENFREHLSMAIQRLAAARNDGAVASPGIGDETGLLDYSSAMSHDDSKMEKPLARKLFSSGAGNEDAEEKQQQPFKISIEHEGESTFELVNHGAASPGRTKPPPPPIATVGSATENQSVSSNLSPPSSPRSPQQEAQSHADGFPMVVVKIDAATANNGDELVSADVTDGSYPPSPTLSLGLEEEKKEPSMASNLVDNSAHAPPPPPLSANGDDQQQQHETTPPRPLSHGILRHQPSYRRLEQDPEREGGGEEPRNNSVAERELRMVRSHSMTESDVGSIEGLPVRLQSTLRQGSAGGRDKVLQRLDGMVKAGDDDEEDGPGASRRVPNYFSKDTDTSSLPPSASISPANPPVPPTFLDSIGLSFLWPNNANDAAAADGADNGKLFHSSDTKSGAFSPTDAAHDGTDDAAVVAAQASSGGDNGGGGGGYWDERADEAFDLLGHCSAIVNNHHDYPAPVASSLVRVSAGPPTYAESIRCATNNEIDPRLQTWVNSHYEIKDAPPLDGTYDLGTSRTVIVHEIARGDWTWCTAWSPKGDRLAVATENHHLAVIETTASTVWRVRHDRRIKGPAVGDTTHSIRCISWGKNFIAVGGTGNAVSILSPIEPYDVLHLIKGTGFVGSLDWKVNSNVLAIGSRTNKMLVVRVRSTDGGKRVESETLYTAQFPNWVNSVAFNPNGSFLVAGNASGTLAVYSIQDNDELDGSLEVNPINEFKLDDSVLCLDWSPEGRWLYAGGEDLHVSVIETTYWEVIHKINRERWVQCIASSASGTHIAVGGVSSEISILDVSHGWDSVMGIELKGLVPLSAAWHPKDQALALTGQNDTVLVVETTNARHVTGHHLHSMSPIIAVEFSPDGRTAVIGNEAGIVTFFSLSGSAFEAAYELVVILNDRLSIDWSLNGRFTVIGSKDALIIVGPNTRGPKKSSAWYKKRLSIGYSVQRVIRNIGETNCVSISAQSHYVAVAGDRTRVYDATKDFALVKSWKTGVTYATAWSPDGHFLATMGFGKVLSIYNTSDALVDRWRAVFSLKCDFNGYALAWGPHIVGGLVYLAYGGANKTIYIMEIRKFEGTWETVLKIPRDGQIRDLDWGTDGLLAAGIDNGTASVIDLSYLQAGIPVNEKDYNWQRQALTCFTEIRRNRGKNSIQAVKWIPSAPGSDSLLAVGGTDGEVEIVDLTERRRCRGYGKKRSGDMLRV